MGIALYIAIVTCLLFFKLFWDFRAMHFENRIINKKKSALIDGLLYALSAYLIFGNVILCVGIVLCTSSYRWIAFDTGFALANNKGWRWYGNSSVLDRFLAKVGGLDILIKLIPAAVGAVIILFSYELQTRIF